VRKSRLSDLTSCQGMLVALRMRLRYPLSRGSEESTLATLAWDRQILGLRRVQDGDLTITFKQTEN